MGTTPTTMAGRDWQIQFGPHTYRYYLREGSAQEWPELRGLFGELDTDQVFLVSDDTLPVYLTEQMAALISTTVKRCTPLTIPGSEQAKTPATVNRLTGEMLALGATRRSCVVALGGGLTGNVAGKAAADLYRGVRLVHMPTTFLAQSDSVLSLKQAVNSISQSGDLPNRPEAKQFEAKNAIGAFHAPVFVWAELRWSDSLPATEMQSGMCEAAKNWLAIHPDGFDDIVDLLNPQARYTYEQLRYFIEFCIAAKTQVMRDDPYEKGAGLVLEYGHTVGHAIELLTHGDVPHGLAIAIGMCVAARVARHMGLLSETDEQHHHDLLCSNGVPTALPANLHPDQVLEVVRDDNKRGYIAERPGFRPMVLLEGIGRPHLGEDGLPLDYVPEEILLAALRELSPSPLAACKPPAVPAVSAVSA